VKSWGGLKNEKIKYEFTNFNFKKLKNMTVVCHQYENLIFERFEVLKIFKCFPIKFQL
jgi:hypothetical protein